MEMMTQASAIGTCRCRLLQNAATSVLGQELISYAKHLGIKTINVVRRKEAVNELKLKGCAHCKRPFLLATMHIH